MKKPVYSLEFKAEALRRMEAGESPSALAKELGVRRNRLYKWKTAVQAGQSLRGRGRPGKAAGEPRPPDGGSKRIAELERLVGRLTAENDFFKGALRRIEELRRANSGSGAMASTSKSKR